MAERKRRPQDKEDLFPNFRKRVQCGFARGVLAGTHVFTDSGDLPLVVMATDAAFSVRQERPEPTLIAYGHHLGCSSLRLR